MNEVILWLPDMISVDGVWEEVLERLYAIFTRDFKQTRLALDGNEVWHDRRIIDGNKEEGFWHLIQREDIKTKERFPDFRRAERLPWCAPSIRHNTDSHVRYWKYREGDGRINVYVWLYEFDYVVILQERHLQQIDVRRPARTVAFLLTAYHLDGPQKRRSFERKYAARVA